MFKGRFGSVILHLAVAVVFVVVSMGRQLLFGSLLNASSQTATAAVTQSHLGHDTCRLAYSVNGKAYNGKGYDCGNTVIGQPVEIHYWPSNPTVSSTRFPDQMLPTRFVGALGILVAASLVGLFRRREHG